MFNTTLTRKGNKLTIEVDLSQNGLISKSSKSVVIASTQGNQNIPGEGEFKIGLNIYKPNQNGNGV